MIKVMHVACSYSPVRPAHQLLWGDGGHLKYLSLSNLHFLLILTTFLISQDVFEQQTRGRNELKQQTVGNSFVICYWRLLMLIIGRIILSVCRYWNRLRPLVRSQLSLWLAARICTSCAGANARTNQKPEFRLRSTRNSEWWGPWRSQSMAETSLQKGVVSCFDILAVLLKCLNTNKTLA